MNLCLKSPSLSYFLPVSKSTSEAREDCSWLGVWLVVVLFRFGLSSDSILLSSSASTQQKSGCFRTIKNRQSTDISLSFHFESCKRFKEDWIYCWSDWRVFYFISGCKSTDFPRFRNDYLKQELFEVHIFLDGNDDNKKKLSAIRKDQDNGWDSKDSSNKDTGLINNQWAIRDRKIETYIKLLERKIDSLLTA